MYNQKKQWFPGLPTFLVDGKDWTGDEGRVCRVVGLFRKDSGQVVLLPQKCSSDPLVQSERGSSLVKSKWCWWVIEEVFKQGLSCQEHCQMVKRHLQVWIARVRSSNHSLARPLNSVVCGTWDKFTLPGLCEIQSALRNWVKFRARITVQPKGAQVTVFISPFSLRQAFVQCWLSILFQQLTMRKNFFLIKRLECRAAGQKLEVWSNLNSNVYYSFKQFMCHCLNSQFVVPGVEHSREWSIHGHHWNSIFGCA